MKKISTLMLVILMMIAAVQFSKAQYTMNQVIVLNSGQYGGPVTVGTYNPTTHVYQTFDSIPTARFSSYVIIDSGFIYVAADSFLIKYDLNTKAKLYTAVVQGIREIAVWNDKLVVTRGQTNPLPSYVQIYGKDSLNFLYDITAVSDRSEGIKVLNDTAYVAVNGFGTVGNLAVIDLNNHVENREIYLDTIARNPFNVEIERSNNTLYTVNSPNYSSTSITKYNANTNSFVNTVVNQSSGCGASAYYLNNIFLQFSSNNNLSLFGTTSLTVWDSLAINENIIGIAIDSVNSKIYVGITDYVNYGKVFIYSLYGALLDSFNVYVSPGNFAFDVVNHTGISTIKNIMNVSVYPNPAHDNLHIIYSGIDNSEVINCTITDVLGNVVKNITGTISSLQNISINDLSKGVYSISIRSDKGLVTNKIVKE
jgi:hypothetical protein